MIILVINFLIGCIILAVFILPYRIAKDKKPENWILYLICFVALSATGIGWVAFLIYALMLDEPNAVEGHLRQRIHYRRRFRGLHPHLR